MRGQIETEDRRRRKEKGEGQKERGGGLICEYEY